MAEHSWDCAIVKLAGGVTVVGRTREETIAGTALLRVDVSSGGSIETRYYAGSTVLAILPVPELSTTAELPQPQPQNRSSSSQDEDLQSSITSSPPSVGSLPLAPPDPDNLIELPRADCRAFKARGWTKLDRHKLAVLDEIARVQGSPSWAAAIIRDAPPRSHIWPRLLQSFEALRANLPAAAVAAAAAAVQGPEHAGASLRDVVLRQFQELDARGELTDASRETWRQLAATGPRDAADGAVEP